MPSLNIKIILGSTREGRFGDKPANWILGKVKEMEGVNAELLDLRDWTLPFFNDPVSPSMAKQKYSSEAVANWAKKIEEADAFVIVTPEYNHGYTAVLKNAMDYVYYEWNKKPVGFVSYGTVGGARSVEQLRGVAVELQMAPIRAAVHIPPPIFISIMKGGAGPELFGELDGAAAAFLEQLAWWARALKTAREAETQ